MPLSDLINPECPEEVVDEVRSIVSLMHADFDFEPIRKACIDVAALFNGDHRGFRACNTRYHDFMHTMHALLAMARLLHGATVAGLRPGRETVTMGLLGALLHDTGYIQTTDDQLGTGAKYTLVHIGRSIHFMERYLAECGFPERFRRTCANILRCTGLDTKIDEIAFESPEEELAGKMLGTADLVAQMADRKYLLKLPFLFHEFREGAVPGFRDELDLFEKTPGFYEFTVKRFETELGSVHRYLALHFRLRWHLDYDPYFEAIERHIVYLRYAMGRSEAAAPERKPYLRLAEKTTRLEAAAI